MEFLSQVIDPEVVSAWEAWFSDWSFVFFIGLFLVELVRLAFLKKLSWTLVGDSITNYVTLGLYLLVTYGVIAGFYVGVFYWVPELRPGRGPYHDRHGTAVPAAV